MIDQAALADKASMMCTMQMQQAHHALELLQKQIDDAGGETLSPSDKLYVVHVKQGKDTKERAWSAGGPLLPSLQMALARYPHTIIELEVQF